MTDPRGQSTEQPAPASAEEAAENLRRDPALNAQSESGGQSPASAEPDAMTDDDARTADTAHSGEVRD